MVFIITSIIAGIAVSVSMVLAMGGDISAVFRKRIYLLDVWGEITPSRLGPGLGTIAYRFPYYRIGQIHLQEDGTVTGPTNYIKKWSYNKEDLV